MAGMFLFGAARRIFDCTSAGVAATALFALNPNVLYLQSIPMTESLFFCCLLALLYFIWWWSRRALGFQQRLYGFLLMAGGLSVGPLCDPSFNLFGLAMTALPVSVCDLPPNLWTG